MLKLITKIGAAVIVAVLVSTSAFADTFTVSGGGNTSLSPSSTAVSLRAEYGLTLNKNVEAYLGQGLSFADKDGTALVGETRIGSRFLTRKFGPFQPYVGVAGSVEYGKIDASWRIIPEIGSRVWFSDKVFAFGSAGYSWLLNSHVNSPDNSIVYAVGIGVNF